MWIIVDGAREIVLTLVVYGWLLIGLSAAVAALISHAEQAFRAEIRHSGEGHDKVYCADCRQKKYKSENWSIEEVIGSIVFGFLCLSMAMVAGPVAAMLVRAEDDGYKESWALIKRKKLDYYGALALPVLALLTLWWM